MEKFSRWCWLAIASLLCGCFTFYKGIDRMVNYDNPDSLYRDSVNAYVGGDAYNYIINGTHATAFFVLTAMFFLIAVGLLIIHYVSKTSKWIETEIYWLRHSYEKNALLEKQAAARKNLEEGTELSDEEKCYLQKLISDIDDELTKEQEL